MPWGAALKRKKKKEFEKDKKPKSETVIKIHSPEASAEILRCSGFYRTWNKDLSQIYPELRGPRNSNSNLH